MAKDKYEISLWEDQLVGSGSNTHYEERKICVIGSDTMTTACRVYEPQLTENVNGTNQLVFKMYYVYSEDGGASKTKQNPFLNLLVNERKVKCFWKNKWYDLVIQNIQEDSSKKSITYTCVDQFINELSKNGFNIELDTELENNQGSASELAAKVLEGTDWQLSSSDTIQQLKEEPVYETTTKTSITVYNDSAYDAVRNKPVSVTFNGNKNILLFYSQIQPLITSDSTSGTTSNLQFLWAQSYATDRSSQLVTNGTCYTVASLNWDKTTISGIEYLRLKSKSTVWCQIPTAAQVSSRYRAKRLLRSQESVLDPLTGKYVNKYKAVKAISNLGVAQNNIIYEYITTEYKDPTVVNNLLVNYRDFTSSNGWRGQVSPAPMSYPPFSAATDAATYTSTSFLKLTSGYVYNTGLRETLNYLPDGFAVGDRFVFRLKLQSNNDNKPSGKYLKSLSSESFANVYKVVEENNTISKIGNAFFTPIDPSSGFKRVGDWLERTMVCKTAIPRSELISSHYDSTEQKSYVYGILLNIKQTAWLEEAQFYPEVIGESDGTSVRINPGEMDIESVVSECYKYYNHTASAGLTDPEKIKYIYSGKTPWNTTSIEPVYRNNFEKIRSISVKQSNRFNILQTIAETFECWIKFEIQHTNDGTGNLVYVNGSPQKFVSIHKEIGQETGLGFTYGLDLKGIQRTIKSDAIVTKTIVSPSENEYGKDGFCTIARSNENYSRDTFILNFDYYITHNLIDGSELNKDLYLAGGDIAYFYNLRRLNLAYDALTDYLANKKLELTKQESYNSLYTDYLSSLRQQVQTLEGEIIQLAGASSWSNALKYYKQHLDQEDITTRINSRSALLNTINQYENMQSSLATSITNLTQAINRKTEEQEGYLDDIEELHAKFYKKYFSFIKEGSWKSDEYIDDNLYYLDAQSVAYTSSRPQVSYNISVIRLSAIEEFQNRVFRLGDIAFIQDTEFFGYINGTTTPYKEKVFVSEVVSNFDSPEKDTFKIQNYKTQFEDLFQRITATTQSLQYASGEYARAADIVETNGSIKTTTLENSIHHNENLVYSVKNESIVQDSTGITVRNLTNPNYITKITSYGVFISTNGGHDWVNAVKGEGITADQLLSAVISTEKFTIQGGSRSNFFWDVRGINAYNTTFVGDQIDLVDTSQFVRFDQYGIYGIHSEDEFKPDVISTIGGIPYEGEDKIWKMADFGLTWHGFFLKSSGNEGYVQITSTDDLQVISTDGNGDHERIKIGRLGAPGYHITSDVTPNDNKTYYIESGLFYDRANLLTFATGYEYYEANGQSKQVTGDVKPKTNKTYYVPISYAQVTLPNVFLGTNYYKLVNSEYQQLTDEELAAGPISGTTYYARTDVITYDYATYDYTWDRAEGQQCYYYEVDESQIGTYVEADMTEDPSSDLTYFIKNTYPSYSYEGYLDEFDEEADGTYGYFDGTSFIEADTTEPPFPTIAYYLRFYSYSEIDLRQFTAATDYYLYSNEEYELVDTTESVPDERYYYFKIDTISYSEAELGRVFAPGETYFYFIDSVPYRETRSTPLAGRMYSTATFVNAKNNSAGAAKIVKAFTPNTTYWEKESGELYGIRIKDDNNSIVMETDSTGQLWLKDKLTISSTLNSGSPIHSIRLGYLPMAAVADQIWTTGFGDTAINLDTTARDGVVNRRTLDVNDKFIVWEDGIFYAQGGYFEGTIHATGGKIGNMSIDDIGATLYRVEISCTGGTVFKNGEGSKTLTAHFYSGETEITSGISYFWYKNGVALGNTNQAITVTADSGNDIYVYDCVVSFTG